VLILEVSKTFSTDVAEALEIEEAGVEEAGSEEAGAGAAEETAEEIVLVFPQPVRSKAEARTKSERLVFFIKEPSLGSFYNSGLFLTKFPRKICAVSTRVFRMIFSHFIECYTERAKGKFHR
jgi:hypothetical protein